MRSQRFPRKQKSNPSVDGPALPTQLEVVTPPVDGPALPTRTKVVSPPADGPALPRWWCGQTHEWRAGGGGCAYLAVCLVGSGGGYGGVGGAMCSLSSGKTGCGVGCWLHQQYQPPLQQSQLYHFITSFTSNTTAIRPRNERQRQIVQRANISPTS